MPDDRQASRRRFLRLGILGAGASMLIPNKAAAGLAAPRALALHNLHTGESLHTVYWVNGRHVPDALKQIDWLLRDYRSDEVREIDRGLLDLLSALRNTLDIRQPFEVISGYRSPATNAMLVATTSGVAPGSLHVVGMAVDLRMPGRSLATLRDAAKSLGGGGVGYYPTSNFVHVDVGRVRYW